MERLLLLYLLSPLIFAQPYKTKKDPNDEPFLPIHPVYPYNPKLIKRGTERALISQLTPELYAPKVEAKDSYSSSYSNNYQRDPYYPDYNSYPKNTSPSSAYPSYYNGDGYAYHNSPYASYNSYPVPYTMNPAAYSTSSYPNYYYQPPYYYPHYFNHALYAQPPLPPSSVDHHETSQDSTETEDDKQDKDKKNEKAKEDETNQDLSTSQFVDGGNYISGNSKDLDGQSSTYKTASPYNQVERNQVQVKNLPIPLPRTTYRVISVAGQPVGPDYPLPAPYVKAQQIEQAMSETLAKLLVQNAQQQSSVDQSYENGRDVGNGANDGSYVNQDTYNPNTPSYSILPSARTKTGVTYAINSDSTAKANGEQTSLRGSSSQRTSNKNTKYTNVYYSQKPASQVTYVPSDNRDKNHVIDNQPIDQTDQYGSYDAMQNYNGAYSQSGDKQEQNYENYQSQSDSYQNKDVAVTPQTHRSYSYQYSAYESDQAQQPQQDKVNLDDGNFGAKQYTKG